MMVATTPHAKAHETLGALDSRYVDVPGLPWTPMKYKGVEMKVLLEDKETGLFTALVRFQPGSELPFHEHIDIEQTYVLEGALEDDEGTATPGNFVWRPAGNKHVARSPNGALVLSVFLKPNRFFDAGHRGGE